MVCDFYENRRHRRPSKLRQTGCCDDVHALRRRGNQTKIVGKNIRRPSALFTAGVIIDIRAAQSSRKIFRRGIGVNRQMKLCVSRIGLL